MPSRFSFRVYTRRYPFEVDSFGLETRRPTTGGVRIVAKSVASLCSIEKHESFILCFAPWMEPLWRLSSAFARIAAAASPRVHCRVNTMCRPGRSWVRHRQTQIPVGVLFFPYLALPRLDTLQHR